MHFVLFLNLQAKLRNPRCIEFVLSLRGVKPPF